jgi:hypothetical protein
MRICGPYRWLAMGNGLDKRGEAQAVSDPGGNSTQYREPSCEPTHFITCSLDKLRLSRATEK